MSILHYLGLLCLSVSWLWRFHLLRPPGALWLPMVLAGLLLLAAAPRGSQAPRTADEPSGRFPASSLALIIPMLLALFTLPRELTTGPLVLTLAVAAGVLRGDGAGRFRPVRGCAVGGAVLTVQGFALPLLALFSAHVHDLPLFGYILVPFVRLFDPAAVASGGRIVVSSIEEIYEFGVSLEKLAFIPLALYVVGVAVSTSMRGELRRSLGRIVAAFIAYAGARFLFVLFAVVLVKDEGLFWERFPIVASLLPLAVILARLAPLGEGGGAAGQIGPVRLARGAETVRAGALLTAGFFLLAGALAFHDPGSMKGGRVLFDEHYSDWEWSTRAYDRQWYGQKSGYNYYSLAEYLGHFFDIERGLEAFTPAYLSRYDVVIVKTPTRPFTGEEIDALESYVKSGGGLFLIGDHTNVFGTSTNLNPLAERFGLRFNYDSTYELATLALSYYVPPPLAAHPSQLYVPDFLFATSCTMDSPLLGEHAIVGYGLRAVMLDYSRTGHFPSKEEKEYRFGLAMQMAGVKHGRGRVLGHTDSTVFSNFFMFIPGKPETFLGALDWLNRRNRFHLLNWLFLAAGLIAAAAGVRMLRGYGPPGAGGTALFGLVLGVVCSLLVFEAAKRASYPPLQPRRAIAGIAFDRDPSQNEMPLRDLVHRPERSLHTFYVWTQRLGLVPVLRPDLRESLASSPIAVVIDPLRRLTIEEVDSVVEFCRRGGSLLLLVEPRNAASSANDLLGIFRMKSGGAVPDTTEIQNLKGERLCTAIHAGVIRGGTPILTLPGAGAVCAYDTLGAGRFVAFADCHIFTQAVMGPTSVVPSRRQREIYELEFQLLELLMGTRGPDAFEPYRAP